MDEMIARAVIVERLRDFKGEAIFLTPAAVSRVSVWLQSDDFLKTCADARADPKAVTEAFNKICVRGLDDALLLDI